MARTRLFLRAIKSVGLVDEGANRDADLLIYKRDFSTEQRDRMAESGTAMPDGSFPIANRSDLMNAIHAIGRAKDRAAAMAHIKRRARALGATDMLPEDWTMSKRKDAPLQKELDMADTAEKEPAEPVVEAKAEEEAAPVTEPAEKRAAPETVSKADYVALEKRLAEAERIAKAERDQRLTREYIEKSRAFSALTVDPEAFGPVLKRLSENAATDEDRAELARVLKAANEMVAQAEQRLNLFGETGRPGGEVESATERVNKLAGEMVTKQEASDYGDAIRKIMRSREHAGLVAEYQSERGQRN